VLDGVPKVTCTREAPCGGILREVLVLRFSDGTIRIEECVNAHTFREGPEPKLITDKRAREEKAKDPYVCNVRRVMRQRAKRLATTTPQNTLARKMFGRGSGG